MYELFIKIEDIMSWRYYVIEEVVIFEKYILITDGTVNSAALTIRFKSTAIKSYMVIHKCNNDISESNKWEHLPRR